MARKKKLTIGSWAFLVGVIFAIIFGIIGTNPTVAWILVIAGLIVGLLNVAEKEVQSFLLTGTVLVILAYFGGSVFASLWKFAGILDAFLYMFVPATVIVALKHVFTIAKS